MYYAQAFLKINTKTHNSYFFGMTGLSFLGISTWPCLVRDGISQQCSSTIIARTETMDMFLEVVKIILSVK